MTSEREEAIDFIVPYFDQTGISIGNARKFTVGQIYYYELVAVIRQPVQTTSLFKFMTVLNTEVWLCVLGALITTGLMIWLLDYFSPYSFKNDPARYPYPCRYV
jgi:ionotropic glutamate receptor